LHFAATPLPFAPARNACGEALAGGLCPFNYWLFPTDMKYAKMQL
jgi:hypothetical protein